MQFPIRSIASFFIVFAVSSFSFSCFAQSNSNYLKLLEGEASNSSIDTKTQAAQKKEFKARAATPINSDGKLPAGLSKEDFLKNLKVNYIGTYFFAKRLTAKQQNEIHTFYQKNNDPQAIRSQVIKISKRN